jgi:hypothetical protein
MAKLDSMFSLTSRLANLSTYCRKAARRSFCVKQEAYPGKIKNEPAHENQRRSNKELGGYATSQMPAKDFCSAHAVQYQFLLTLFRDEQWRGGLSRYSIFKQLISSK